MQQSRGEELKACKVVSLSFKDKVDCLLEIYLILKHSPNPAQVCCMPLLVNP